MRRALLIGLLTPVLGCGVGALEPSASSRSAIVNGAADPQHSAVVALISFDSLVAPTNGATCAGTIVHQQNGVAYVLTAAHCFARLDAGWSTVVGVGPDYTQLRQRNIDAGFPIRDLVIHPFYRPLDADRSFDDLAMLKFDAPAGLDTLPVLTRELDDLALGSNLTLVGYGAVTAGAIGGNVVRRSVTRPISELDATSLTVNQRNGGGGQCQGDSGGPTLYARNGREYVAGVMSHGDMLCADHGTSARVSDAVEGFVARYLQGQQPSTVMTCGDCRVRGTASCTAECAPPVQPADAGASDDAGTSAVPDAGGLDPTTTEPMPTGCATTSGSGASLLLSLIALLYGRRRQRAL